MTWDEFQEMVAAVERLTANLTDFHVARFCRISPPRKHKGELRTAREKTKAAS